MQEREHMLEQPSLVYEETSEGINRRGVAYFLDIRNQLLDKIGIQDVDAAGQLAEDLKIREGIDLILSRRMEKRQQGILSSLHDIMKDWFREEIPASQFSDRLFRARAEQFAEGWQAKTRSLENWRAHVEQEIERNKSLIDMVHAIERDPEVERILRQYNCSSLEEFLQLKERRFARQGLSLAEVNEHPDHKYNIWLQHYQRQILFLIQYSLEYRNRKINEFMTYRYANTVSIDYDIETFIHDAHFLSTSENGASLEDMEREAYRKVDLPQRDQFFTPVPAKLLPFVMKALCERAESVEPMDNTPAQLLETVKYYLAFELIHPYEEGNGRAGRALFVYLQRRFRGQKDQKGFHATHIPIARYLTGSTRAREVSTSEYNYTYPGSLHFDIDILAQKILRDNLLKADLTRIIEVPIENMDDMACNALTQELLDVIFTHFNGAPSQHNFDLLVEMIQSQSRRDNIEDEDLQIVTKPLKDLLKR